MRSSKPSKAPKPPPPALETFWLDGENVDQRYIVHNLYKYTGCHDSTVKTIFHDPPYEQHIRGFWYSAYRPLTSAQISTIQTESAAASYANKPAPRQDQFPRRGESSIQGQSSVNYPSYTQYPESYPVAGRQRAIPDPSQGGGYSQVPTQGQGQEQVPERWPGYGGGYAAPAAPAGNQPYNPNNPPYMNEYAYGDGATAPPTNYTHEPYSENNSMDPQSQLRLQQPINPTQFIPRYPGQAGEEEYEAGEDTVDHNPQPPNRPPQPRHPYQDPIPNSNQPKDKHRSSRTGR